MKDDDFLVWIDMLRIVCTFVGAVVILMWLWGIVGLADFRLIFTVPEGST